MKGKQTQINFYTNLITLFASVGVGIYYTPYLVQHLGTAAYGILPLALIINNLINIITSTLTSAFSRFYSIALQQQKHDEASEYLTTSLMVTGMIIMGLTPLFILLVHNIDTVFTIQEEYLVHAQILFATTFVSFFLALISSILNITLYAYNRLDWINLTKILRVVLKLVLVILFFESFSPDIIYVGFTGLVVEVLILGISLVLFYRYKPGEVGFRWNKFNKVALWSMVAMAVWVLIQQCGDMLLYRSDNYIFNKFFGLEASGALGVVSELGTYLQLAITVISTLYGPLILIAYAHEDHHKVQELALSQSYIVGSLTAILVGVIGACAIPVLQIWINPEFSVYHLWLILKIIILPYYAAGGILAFVYRSWNRVMLPAILTVMIGIVDIGTMVFMAHSPLFEHPALWVLGASAFFGLLQSYCLNTFIIGKIYPQTIKPLLFNFLRISIILCGSYFIASWVLKFIELKSIYGLILYGGCTTLGILAVIFFTLFRSDERKKTIAIIK